MKKTEHQSKAYSLDVVVRTESGRCEVSMGLDDLSKGERQFLFDTLRRTSKGGAGQLGLQETGPGEKTLTLLLKEPISVDTGVRAAFINGTH